MAKKATAKKVAVKGQLRPVVPIRISAEGKVLDPSVTVRVGQDVIWVAQNVGGPWTITFVVSPFSQSVYTVPRGGIAGTTGGAIKRGTYPYTVRDEIGRITDEAEVVVE